MELSQARLLFVITSSGVGGSEKILAHLARAERPRWAAVGVCSLKPPGRTALALEREGIAIFSCWMREGRGPRGVLSTAAAGLRLLRVIRRFRPTLIHAFLFRAGLLARLPRLSGDGPRLVVSVRRVETRGRLAHLLDRWSAGKVDRFTAVSEETRRQICRRSGIPAKAVERIPNGIEVPMPAGGEAADRSWFEQRRAAARRRLEALTGPLPPLLIGSVGRLEPVKGHRCLLEAMARLIPAGAGANPGAGAEVGDPSVPRLGAYAGSAPDPGVGLGRAGLVLLGDGSERRALQRLASRPPLAGRVWILGERDDARDLLPALDLFVLPSLSEGMSNALLEAMAEGIPVVATRAGGTPEVVREGVSGLLAEPGEPAALAGAIAKMVTLGERAAAYGLAGREAIRRDFSTASMLRAYRRIYSQLVDPL
jgi:glycosyltransferase involved in cell wall biosynthesis